MGHNYNNKAAEEKCRQTARMVSAADERSRLLEMSQTWEVLAERREKRRRGEGYASAAGGLATTHRAVPDARHG
jgi:hypothetical protein